jgi:hypothetical protein
MRSFARLPVAGSTLLDGKPRRRPLLHAGMRAPV